MTEDGRPDPDALLAALDTEQHGGRLKIFLGAAPGVGKTWEMLNQARRRAAEGVEVLAGIIETHGRAETEAQLGDLPLLPRRRIDYRGQPLEEFDLDAALARRPALLLVDELAHTNAPGSRHAKRWQDVAELLAAGIPVWTTLNVQHLESLNDDIVRITGIRPTETLPDRVLELAAEIELVDLPPGELRQRLRDGRIYRPETAARALDGFFNAGNLAALREIAMRRAATHVDGDVRHWMQQTGIAGPWPSAERVIALIGTDSAAGAVIRQSKRLADALHTHWIALHIERPGSAGPSPRAALDLATQLGAEVDQRTGAGDLVALLLNAARDHNASHIVLGRGRGPLWRRLLGRNLGSQLLRQAPEFVLHVVPASEHAILPRHASRPRPSWLIWAGTLGIVTGITAAGFALRDQVPVDAASMIYLAAVVGIAAAWGTYPALFAAASGLLAWDFFFVPPIYTVTIDRPRDIITAVVFAAVALLTGSLAGRVRAEVQAAGTRIEGLRRIGAFSRKLGEPATEPDLLEEIARQAAALAQRAVVLTGENLAVAASEPTGISLDEGAMAAAAWSWNHDEPAGRNTGTLPSAAWRFQPLRTIRGRLGVLGIGPEHPLDDPLLQALDALADQAAAALERVRLAADAARANALHETQQLRTALLASLGHDLRTPLAGIQGAAGTLRTAWSALSGETRNDLLESIEQDVGRMSRFLTNITDLTRLESGEVRPRIAAHPLAEIVEAAVLRTANALFVTHDIPPALAVQADPALLEQVIVNLLDNAAKYSPHGTPVRIAGRAQSGQARLRIADEGVGIPADDLPHVFDSFFRTRQQDRVAPGTGLGLAIARGLIEAMGGAISAQSPNPDAARDGLPGTVVTVSIPLA